MRILATISFSSFFALLAAVTLTEDLRRVLLFLCLAACIVTFFLRKRKKWIAYFFAAAGAMSAAMLFFGIFEHWIVTPLQTQCGEEQLFRGTVCAWPEETTYGGRVTVRLDGFPLGKAVYYGDEDILELRPGNHITGPAAWQDAGHIHDSDVTTFYARGIYVLLYDRGELTVEPGDLHHFRWWPQRVSKAFRETIAAIWDEDTAPIITAELTGDKTGMSDGDYAAIRDVGLAHLFAVSGLHCAFLVSLVTAMVPAHRRYLSFGITAALLLFYMAMVGFTPSVVRACIMQIFLLIAPLLRRESDPLTSLGAALLVILAANPYAVWSVSLQLSFAATLSMVLICPKLYPHFMKLYRGNKRWGKRMASFVAADLSASLGAMVLTVPLVVYHFNTMCLVSPLSILLALAPASWNFMVSFLTTLLGFLSLPLARAVGIISAVLVRYLLWVVGILQKIPYHTLYFSNHYLYSWLPYVYGLLVNCFICRGGGKRKYVLTAILAVGTLTLSLYAFEKENAAGTLSVVTLDVGQGESILLLSEQESMLVDCGSSNGGVFPGSVAMDALISRGRYHLDVLAVTHYHADHTNGLEEVLGTVSVGKMLLPDVEDEYGVREKLLLQARRRGIPVEFVTEETSFSLGSARVTVYPPVGVGDLNEQGLAFLATAGEFDMLITGDMEAATERALAAQYPLPDIEVLIVSHHGSKYSSDSEFLAQIKPETAIISVGENNHGHPTEEALDRLWAAGAEVYCTDENGTIIVSVNEEAEGEV